MLSSGAVILIFCLYMGLLFGLALWAQHRAAANRSLVDNPLVYALSLAVYCSSWTFFGSVGLAANRGPLFLTVYLGPTLVAIFGGGLWARMIRLKNTHRITSIADFISTRYEKSEGLAALVTVIALVGTVPYVGLQLKAVLSSFAVLTASDAAPDGWVPSHVSTIVLGLMVLFTIIFGVRRLEPSERHEGMVMAVAAESLVKLISMVAVGVFVSYYVFDGLDDIFRRSAEAAARSGGFAPPANPTLLTWTTYMILAANAILCLPRQFHITVVENRRISHVRWAMVLFPLYLLLINIFIHPMALGGLLRGFPAAEADTFVLLFPLRENNHAMALLAFIGGFSAATSMILISSMTMSTMISNHLLLPLVDWFPSLAFIERRLLQCRWLAVAGFIYLGYLFEKNLSGKLGLADLGMLSFAAVLQLGPAMIGGLYWRGGNKQGAAWGLTAGFLIWAYTLLLPIFDDIGLIPSGLVKHGLFGLGLLRPQSLFGLDSLDPIPHAVFWSLLGNVFFFILGSLRARSSQENQSLAEAFVGGGEPSKLRSADRRRPDIPLDDKRKKTFDIFARFFGPQRAGEMTGRVLAEVGLAGKKLASMDKIAELYDLVEKTLGGSIGAAAASRNLAQAEFFSPDEYDELKNMYAEILADLRAHPADLKRKIDFYKEREALIKTHARELEEKVEQLELQIGKRLEAESKLRDSEDRYRLAIECSSDGVAVIRDERIVWGNPRLAEIFGYPALRDLLGCRQSDIIHPDDRERVLDFSRDRQRGIPSPSRYDYKGVKRDGTPIYIAVSVTTMNYQGETQTLAFLRDVTSRRLAEEQIHGLSRRLMDGIEEDRRRLAADLHDEFGQALTGLHLGLESLIQSIPESAVTIRVNGIRLLYIIERLAESLRNISSELRPDMLDHLGLIPTIEWYIDDFKGRAQGLEVDFQAVGFRDRRLDSRCEIVLYRILQEALNNVVKHAEASRVAIRLTYSHPQVIMTIADNGQGFNTDEGRTISAAGKSGLGLVGMRERVAAVGGQIDIRSAKGQGASIRVTLTAGSGVADEKQKVEDGDDE